MAQLVWAPRAIEDLDSLIAYISRNSPATARQFAAKIVARVERLEQHPFSGGWVLEDDTRTYREVLHGSYRAIYRVEEDTVFIVAVHHAARLLDVDDLA